MFYRMIWTNANVLFGIRDDLHVCVSPGPPLPLKLCFQSPQCESSPADPLNTLANSQSIYQEPHKHAKPYSQGNEECVCVCVPLPAALIQGFNEDSRGVGYLSLWIDLPSSRLTASPTYHPPVLSVCVPTWECLQHPLKALYMCVCYRFHK